MPLNDEEEDLAALPALEQVIQLKSRLLAKAQGDAFDGGDVVYRALRKALRNDPTVYARLPDFVRRCGSVGEFWGFIRPRFATYGERREFLREEFAPVIEYLELDEWNPGVLPVSEMLATFNAEAVRAAWEKALDRRVRDPEGAITAARTLIETVCKHILDDAGVSYTANEDLPKLWQMTAEQLNLAPSQHQETIFKAILGNCQSVVNNLAAIRNSIGDAHGAGRKRVKPTGRHAELAVNLAGSMAAFLVATWQERGASSASTSS